MLIYGFKQDKKTKEIRLVKPVRRHKDFYPSPPEHTHTLKCEGAGKTEDVEREMLCFKVSWATSIWNKVHHLDKKWGEEKSQNDFWC